MLCKLNHDVLIEIYGSRLTVIELTKKPIRGLESMANAFDGHIDGVNSEAVERVFKDILSRNIEKIFIDGSNFGGIAKIVKERFPNVEILTFFHNVEVRFFWGSFRQTRSVRALAVAVANYLAERKSVKYSDKIICLSERDSRLLHKIYGRAATHVSSMALEDKMPTGLNQVVKPVTERFALFVGGTFYANRAGISWFIEYVVPRINIKICIVGRGFEALRKELACDGKVEVIGAVDHLADWYRDAHFVIAPIFDGSGMKTKVAEALMYGKKVIGTPEAFSGYEEIVGVAGHVCVTAEDFVEAIDEADVMVKSSFDGELRSIYKQHYSFEAALSRFRIILDQ